MAYGEEPKGHQTTIVNKKEATCTESGYTGDTVCTVCGKTVLYGEEIPVKEHTYGEWVVTEEATCQKEGCKERECSVCHKIERETIEQLDHHFSFWRITRLPGWKTDGELTHTCLNCGERESRIIKAFGSWFGHIW